MKKIILVLISIFFANAFAQTNSTTSFEKATSENKKVLLYFSGSDWCAPCVKFKKTFIYNEDFKAFAEKNLVLINADFPRLSKNKLAAEVEADNEKLAEQYNPNGIFPLIILLDANKKIIKKWEGLPDVSVPEFIESINK